ncbi:hypothetical protein SAMN04489859_103348 [Paracoccus alcaliphilus]|uniref:Uncharacterized protein n=1 Tax=Paracoccus alcaliphilus TaxID=34002 RepID=A0A1H8LTD4_9RHOB|nr:hypothetical protein SAMN04489859_103348 [Paracoccus alcaliphilus]
MILRPLPFLAFVALTLQAAAAPPRELILHLPAGQLRIAPANDTDPVMTATGCPLTP